MEEQILWWEAVAAVVCWLALLAPAHVASLRSASYRQSNRTTRGEWLSRVNSNVHAVGATAGFYYAIFHEPAGGLHDGGVFANRALFRGLLIAGLGYFISDSLIVLRLLRTISSPWSTLAHHGLCAASVLYVLRQDVPLTYVWCGLMFLTELSTVCVNQRFFLAIRHRKQRCYVFTGGFMTLCFVLVRPLGIPFGLWWMWHREALYMGVELERLHAIYAIGVSFTAGLYALNLHWSRLMVTGLLRALRNKRQGLALDDADERPPGNGFASPAVVARGSAGGHGKTE
jgi:TLC domain